MILWIEIFFIFQKEKSHKNKHCETHKLTNKKNFNKCNKQNSIVLSEENVRQFEKLVSLLFLSINVVKYLKVKRKN